MLARTLIRLSLVLALTGTSARAFQGPYASVVTGPGGFALDLDIRWPDGAPPPGGWPVVFWAHGAGGDKTSLAGNAQSYANDGYVTLTWTGRDTATAPTPATLAGDVVALKSWVVNDFETEASVTVPVDPARFGLTGSSLGGYTSWSGGLLSNEFATIVPWNWGFHFFDEGLTLHGSIDRRTAGPLASLLGDPYDAAGLQTLADAVFDPAIDAFATCAIPVMTQLAFLDARTGGTYALRDYEALTAAPARLVYIGTGGHGTPETDGALRSDLRERWFDHYLKGEATGIESELPIQLALVGTNEHLAYASWPVAEPATVWLRDAGMLAPTPPLGVETPDTIVNDPGTYTWDDAAPNFPPVQIRNNVSKDLIAWQTAPLTDEVLLIGEPSVRLELTGTGSRYQVNVHLYDQLDGNDPLLLAFGTATVATSPTVVDVPLSLTARRVPAGHRLVLQVTNRDDQDVDYTNGFDPSSDILRYIPFFELSTTSVFHDTARPSSLTVPLVGRSLLPLAGVVCDPAPRTGCRLPALAERSPLTLKNLTPDTRDSLKWKWSKGEATLFGDLGNPLDGDGYAFCLYNAGTLLLETRAPAGDVCATKPCWKQLGSPTEPKGYRYTDKDLTPTGLKKVQVQAGETLKAKAIVAGKGESLPDPTLPLPLPVVAQLQTSAGCWEVTYATATVNDATLFKAK